MTQCCPLYADDDDGPSFYTETYRKAAKTHKCCECDEDIVKGVRYECVSGKWDGDVRTYKTCLSCVEIRDHFACGNGFYHEMLWEQLEDNFFPKMPAGGPCFEGLSPAAKQRLFDRRIVWLGVPNETL